MCSSKCRPDSRPACRRNGFTLLELLAAIVAIGFMTAIALPVYTGAVEKGRISVAIGDVARIDGALERYRSNSALSVLPANLGELGMGELNDPWGNPYQYLNIEVGVNQGSVRKDRNLVPLNTDYDLYSMGKDGASKKPLTAADSRDDILRAGNGGFIGPAEDF
jgi:general secretion pathway protein G